MVIEHAKETNQQENTTLPGANIQSKLCQLYVNTIICTNSEMEQKVSLVHHHQTQGVAKI
jgi:hypothetical protein